MGVFNLTGDGQVPEQQVPNQEVDQTTSESNVTNETPLDTEQKQGDQENKEEKFVILDGPLSKIYTAALNLVYANEGTSSMVSFLEAQHKSLTTAEDIEEDRLNSGNSVTEDGTYVYCLDSADLDGEGMILVTESLREAKKKYSKIVVAMENKQHVGSRAQLLMELCGDTGIDISFNRNSAINKIISSIKG